MPSTITFLGHQPQHKRWVLFQNHIFGYCISWQILADLVRSFQIFTHSNRSWQISADLDRSWQILTDLSRSWQILTDLSGSWQILADLSMFSGVNLGSKIKLYDNQNFLSLTCLIVWNVQIHKLVGREDMVCRRCAQTKTTWISLVEKRYRDTINIVDFQTMLYYNQSV